ncbi:MAG TPA: RsmE family RNA methyltransferase [Pirellulales bacterium]|jgi:16S rRNA (uracil1498-N3)-methyltransferase
MSHRYFVEETIVGDQAVLAGPEAHHLAHVMRAKVGAEVTLFDGSGREHLARVVKIERAAIYLAILSTSTVDREVSCPLVVGVSLPKGDRQRWLVEKLVELGVTRFVPLTTSRGVAQLTDGALARLERAVIEAAKQCERNRLMEIAPPQTWNDFILQAPADALRLVAHPGMAKKLRELPAPTRAWGIIAAVGPEGGLTDEEVRAAQEAGWTAVDLGPRILRVETAAALLAGWGAMIAESADLSAKR